MEEDKSEKYIPLEEFVKIGYLQEVNRQFFHPLGLALSIIKTENNEYIFGGILDCRDSPRGIHFTDKIASSVEYKRKINKIRKERNRIDETRGHLLGYSIQPILKKDKE